mmetsp:Transcript_22423/g.72804  ORF Transcript_22423/g.72804 Transcript_22423/m.72804 type:complete len:475 (-) Transcript_22423:166-1590(-)
MIKLDLTRLFPGDAFFSCAATQAALENVLMLWALENATLAYRQGMHEVAGLLFSLLCTESTGRRHQQWDEDEDASHLQVVLELSDLDQTHVSPSAGVTDLRYVEHDTYALFDAFMRRPARGGLKGLSTLMFYEDPPKPEKGKLPAASPIQVSCQRIYIGLRAADEPLHEKLLTLGLEPQFFLLRWLRLLFLREFPPDDVVDLWDAIVAETSRSSTDVTPGIMIEAVAVAMILFMRTSLMEATDFGFCVRRLQSYPPVEDISVIIDSAFRVLPVVNDACKRDISRTAVPAQAPAQPDESSLTSLPAQRLVMPRPIKQQQKTTGSTTRASPWSPPEPDGLLRSLRKGLAESLEDLNSATSSANTRLWGHQDSRQGAIKQGDGEQQAEQDAQEAGAGGQEEAEEEEEEKEEESDRGGNGPSETLAWPDELAGSVAALEGMIRRWESGRSPPASSEDRRVVSLVLHNLRKLAAKRPTN